MGGIAGKIFKLLIFKINDRFAAIIIATGRSYGQIIVLKQGEIRFALKSILFIVLLKDGLTVIILTTKVLKPPLQGKGGILDALVNRCLNKGKRLGFRALIDKGGLRIKIAIPRVAAGNFQYIFIAQLPIDLKRVVMGPLF